MGGELTEKQKRFVEEYLVDLNAGQAALRAGYKSPDTGRRLTGTERVAAAIRAEMKKREARTGITQDAVLRELAAIGFASAADFMGVRDGSVYFTDTDRLERDKLPALAGVRRTSTGVEIKLHDKVRALELLGKHLGMFDRKADSGPGDGGASEGCGVIVLPEVDAGGETE